MFLVPVGLGLSGADTKLFGHQARGTHTIDGLRMGRPFWKGTLCCFPAGRNKGLHLELEKSVSQGAKPAKLWAGAPGLCEDICCPKTGAGSEASTVPRGPHLVWLEADQVLGVIFNTNMPVRGEVGQ